MNTSINILIIIGSLFILGLFYLKSTYRSKYSYLGLVIGLILLFLTVISNNFQEIIKLNFQNTVIGVIYILIPFIHFLYTRKENITKIELKLDYFKKFLFVYIFFGIAQQIFFLSIFTYSVFKITNSNFIALILGSIFYFIFHLNKDSVLIKVPIYVFIFGFINTYNYLYLDTILPAFIMHGFAGAVTFTILSNENILEKTLSKEN